MRFILKKIIMMIVFNIVLFSEQDNCSNNNLISSSFANSSDHAMIIFECKSFSPLFFVFHDHSSSAFRFCLMDLCIDIINSLFCRNFCYIVAYSSLMYYNSITNIHTIVFIYSIKRSGRESYST